MKWGQSGKKQGGFVVKKACDVEFVNPDGSTRALLTLAPKQIRRLAPADALTTRQLPIAF